MKLPELVFELFINREDVYAEGYLNGSRTAYAKKVFQITKELITQHLQGKKTIGIYQLKDKKVKWGCLDFDENTIEDFEKAKTIYNFLKEKGYHPLMENSGGGQYKTHIWIFATVTAYTMRRFLEQACELAKVKAHEIFPKQTEVKEDEYGNLVKLPLATHPATKKKSFLYDDDFNEEKSIEERLSKHLLMDSIEEIEEEKPKINLNGNNNTNDCQFLNYCLTHKLPKGKRHEIISRNMAIYIHKRIDREALKKAYITIQEGSDKELDNWLKGIEKGKNAPFSCGELINYQKEFNIPSKCKGCLKLEEYKQSNNKKTYVIDSFISIRIDWYDKKLTLISRKKELTSFNIRSLNKFLRNKISKEFKDLGIISLKEVPEVNAKIQDIFNQISDEQQAEKEKEKLELLNPKEEIIQKFQDKELLYNVHEELSKDHLEDDKEKMTLFLVECSAYAKNPRDRKSMSLKGDPSAGKDNMMDSTLKHFPAEHWIKLTSGTQATLEDDIKEKKIIAFSEVNAAREDGANKVLTEVIKQITEGGTSALKKDATTGYAISKHTIQEQKTVIKATTEEENEDETQTRFIEGTIQGNKEKTAKVNKNSCDQVSDLNKLFHYEKKESWIAQGIRSLKILDVWMPYARLFKKKITLIEEGKDGDGKEKIVDIFDNSDPRSQRDVKRLLALTKAMTWLHQHQRNIIEFNSKKIIVSEPVDFLNTLEITGDCFNQTYKGFDSRLQSVIDKIKELTKEVEGLEDDQGEKLKGAARDEVQEALGIKSKNTIKSRLWMLQGLGAVKWLGNAGNNKVYYACQEHVNCLSLTVKRHPLKQHLFLYSTKEELENQGIITDIKECKTAEFDIDKAIKRISVNNVKKNKLVFYEKIDTCQIDTRQIGGNIPVFLCPGCGGPTIISGLLCPKCGGNHES